jgi:hypothetical protein
MGASPDNSDEDNEKANDPSTWCGEAFALDGMPKVNAGEVTYIHSAILTGCYTKLQRLAASSSGQTTSEGCFMPSGRECVDGNFELQYVRVEDWNGRVAHNYDDDDDENKVFVLAHRGLDDAAACGKEVMHDINFREVLDTVIEGPILLRAVGVGDWHVHGWVGRLQDIPRSSSSSQA